MTAAEALAPPPSFASIDREVQAIKRELLEINEELSRLEDELLYPPAQRLTVFLSLPSDTPIRLAFLEVDLDGTKLVRHRYSEAEVAALRQGGVQKPFVGKIAKGGHLLEARAFGRDAAGRAFEMESRVEFAKGPDSKYVELRVETADRGSSPQLSIHHW